MEVDTSMDLPPSFTQEELDRFIEIATAKMSQACLNYRKQGVQMHYRVRVLGASETPRPLPSSPIPFRPGRGGSDGRLDTLRAQIDEMRGEMVKFEVQLSQ
ncbi:hypothetical protein FOPE_01465 [Fonsecaea pedrosoi]|nr:hypothetical protein FOPE_01465 [Fonsecaea pedrosoi]